MLRNPYEYRRRLPHYQKADTPVFVTFRKGTRQPLPEAARSLVLQRCLYGDGSRFHLYAVVVMPEHVHLLMTPLRDPQGNVFCLSEILRGIKGASARSVNQLLGGSGPLWQEESFDHWVRTPEEFARISKYIENNPVSAGLVKRPEDWPWSSARK